MNILKTITFPGDTEPRVIVDGATQNMIGDLNNLKTEIKDNAVNAINEVHDSEISTSNKVSTLETNVSTNSTSITNLQTNVSTNSTNITNLQTQLDSATEQFTIALNGKITSPSTGAVDQILAVAAADDSGKPTSWKTIDMVNVIEIDTTLSTSGAAADSAAVGTVINNTNIIIGDLNNLKTTDKSNLVAAINEVSSSSGGSSSNNSFILKKFDFEELKIVYDGTITNLSFDTSAIVEYLMKGPIQIGFYFTDLNKESKYVYLIVQYFQNDSDTTIYQTETLFRDNNKYYLIHIDFTNTGINGYAKELILIPTYTESDYGKVLGCFSTGLAWTTVETEILQDVEEVKF